MGPTHHEARKTGRVPWSGQLVKSSFSFQIMNIFLTRGGEGGKPQSSDLGLHQARV